MTWLLITTFILLIIFMIIGKKDKSNKILLGMCMGMLIAFLLVVSLKAYWPEAIDVYRDNTELKTNNAWYLQDTIVVWKNKKIK
jgi:archaellum biogenesis protein FlaJ (TadC family)